MINRLLKITRAIGLFNLQIKEVSSSSRTDKIKSLFPKKHKHSWPKPRDDIELTNYRVVNEDAEYEENNKINQWNKILKKRDDDKKILMAEEKENRKRE